MTHNSPKLGQSISKPCDNNEAPPRLKVVHIETSGYSFAPTPATAAAAQQFTEFMKDVIQSITTGSMTATQRTVACVIAFELLRGDDLLPFLDAIKNAQRLGVKTYVTWSTPRGQQRRELSPFTLISFARCVPDVEWAGEIATFNQRITTFYEFGTTKPIHRTLATVFLDLQAWAYLHLPMPLMASYLQVLPITHLPDSAWFRRFRLVAPIAPSVQMKQRDMFGDADGQVMETLLESKMSLSGYWVITELLEVFGGLCGVGVKISDTRARRQLAVNLNRLARKLDMAGPNEALMVGWAIHLTRFGSARKADPKVSTVFRYLSAGARQIYAAMRTTGAHPCDINTCTWKEMFKDLLKEHDGDSIFRNATISFHTFLIRMLDVEPQNWLYRSSLDYCHTPRANMIWPHEIQALPDAISTSSIDDRMAEQAIAWSLLLTSVPMRISELKWIRLSDVTLANGQLELDILAHRHAGFGKTNAASRKCQTDDQRCIVTLLAWRDRREKEGADLDDLLFGDPHNKDKLYRFGASYTLLNKALKIVTGDPEFSSHLCRHTVISHAIEYALFNLDKAQEVNPLHIIKVAAGHKSEETTITSYFHLPESCCRHWIDHALRQIKFAYKPIEAWTGIKGSALAQKQHRGKADHWHVMDAVQSAAVERAPVCTMLIHQYPEISNSTPTASRIRLAKIVDVVADYQAGHNTEALGLRNSIDASMAHTIVDAIHGLYGLLTTTKRGTGVAQNAADKSVAPARSKIDFYRMREPRWVYACKAAASVSSEDQSIVSRYWLSSVRGGTIELVNSHHMLQFLEFLKHCGIGANRIVVRIDGKHACGQQKQEINQPIRDAFATAFGLTPQFEVLGARRGREACAIQVLTRPVRSNCVVAPATNDTQTLSALIFSIFVFLEVQAEEHRHARS